MIIVASILMILLAIVVVIENKDMMKGFANESKCLVLFALKAKSFRRIYNMNSLHFIL